MDYKIDELMGDMITECNVCGNKERHPMAWGHNCSSTKDCSGTQQMLNETEECGHCKGECVMDEYVTTTGG
tara:strand:- start:294 stop:506 length:213 start_codon:yes stop_codon:yes gene_type:complete